MAAFLFYMLSPTKIVLVVIVVFLKKRKDNRDNE